MTMQQSVFDPFGTFESKGYLETQRMKKISKKSNVWSIWRFLPDLNRR